MEITNKMKYTNKPSEEELANFENKCKICNYADLIADYIVALTRFSPEPNTTKEDVVAMVNSSASDLFDEIGII